MKTSIFLHKTARKVGEIPARLAALSLASPLVREQLERRRLTALASLQAGAPQLLKTDQRIVEDLKTTGIHVTSLDALGVPSSAQMLEACMELAQQYRELHVRGALDAKDAFQASGDDLLFHRAIFDWGLNERLLDIVESYLGQPAGYDGVNLFYTKADGRQVAARKWHRDVEDRRVLKIAVYATDVDDEAGPFQLLHSKVPGADAEAAPSYPVFTQEALESRLGGKLDDSQVATCRGPAGTVIFAETGLHYHRGKPATANDRCAVFFNYFARWPLRPYFCDRGTLSPRQLEQMSKAYNERQRACLYWRRTVPLFLRLIKTAPIER